MLASCWAVQITTSSFLEIGASVLCCRLSPNRLNTCMTSCLRGQNIGLIQASGQLHSCHDIWDKTTEKHTENLLCNAQAWNHDCVGKRAEPIGLTGVYLCLLGVCISANAHLYIRLYITVWSPPGFICSVYVEGYVWWTRCMEVSWDSAWPDLKRTHSSRCAAQSERCVPLFVGVWRGFKYA